MIPEALRFCGWDRIIGRRMAAGSASDSGEQLRSFSEAGLLEVQYGDSEARTFSGLTVLSWAFMACQAGHQATMHKPMLCTKS